MFITLIIGIIEDLFEDYFASKIRRVWQKSFIGSKYKKWKKKRKAKNKNKDKNKQKLKSTHHGS